YAGFHFLHKRQGRGRFCRAARLRKKPRQRACQPVVWILFVRLTAMSGRAFGAHLQPDPLLFSDSHAVNQLVRTKEVVASQPALVEEDSGIEPRIMMGDPPERTASTADLLVGVCEQDDVARPLHTLPLECKKRHDLRDALPLHVKGATAPQLGSADYAREWV